MTNPNLFPVGWRWLNPLWWVWAWAERSHRHNVRLVWLKAYAMICTDDLSPSDRAYWVAALDEADAEMNEWCE